MLQKFKSSPLYIVGLVLVFANEVAPAAAEGKKAELIRLVIVEALS